MLTVHSLKIDGNLTLEKVSAALDVQAEFHFIDNINWPNYPYKPEVRFKMAYNEGNIFLKYFVNEKTVRAKYGEDNGKIWTDSCVELFCIPGNDDIYYNLEFNCIGATLIGAGASREGRQRAGIEITSQVQRLSSLGNLPFEERAIGEEWNITLIIPFSAFYLHQITSLKGKTIRGNFYKCGDELTEPHFVSWNPIRFEKPNFHLPEFFGKIMFD
jgi:hypothetical protein